MVRRDIDSRDPGLVRLSVTYLTAYAIVFTVLAWWLS